MRKKDILVPMTTWLKLEDIEDMLLSEISQRKTNTTWNHLSNRAELRETESGEQRLEWGWGSG